MQSNQKKALGVDWRVMTIRRPKLVYIFLTMMFLLAQVGVECAYANPLSTARRGAAVLQAAMHALPGTEHSIALRRYLEWLITLPSHHREWECFVHTMDRMVIGLARRFSSNLDDVSDARQIFYERLFGKWIQGYLDAPDAGPFATFVRDRFRDLLRSQHKTDYKRRIKVATMRPVKNTPGESHSALVETWPENGSLPVARPALWENPPASPEAFEIFREGIELLPRETRGIIHRIIVEGHTLEEVAAELGVHRTTISRRLERVLQKASSSKAHLVFSPSISGSSLSGTLIKVHWYCISHSAEQCDSDIELYAIPDLKEGLEFSSALIELNSLKTCTDCPRAQLSELLLDFH
jgi:RNA polymerase sigma factor (sigma-70 family)